MSNSSTACPLHPTALTTPLRPGPPQPQLPHWPSWFTCNQKICFQCKPHQVTPLPPTLSSSHSAAQNLPCDLAPPTLPASFAPGFTRYSGHRSCWQRPKRALIVLPLCLCTSCAFHLHVLSAFPSPISLEDSTQASLPPRSHLLRIFYLDGLGSEFLLHLAV